MMKLMEEEKTPNPLENGFKFEWNLRRRIVAGVAAVAISGAAVAGFLWSHYDRAGQYEIIDPTEQIDPQIDSTVRFGTLNTHNEFRPELVAGMINENNLDGLALQELSMNNAERYSKRFPGWYFSIVTADAKKDLLLRDGGQTNAIMTRQKPEDPKTQVMGEYGPVESGVQLFKGLTKDFVATAVAASPTVKNTEKSLIESRAAIIVSIKFLDGSNKVRTVKLATSHLTPNTPDQQSQIEQYIDFLKDNRAGGDIVSCLDSNEDPEPYILPFAKEGFVTPLTGPTDHSGRTLDFCTYSASGYLGLGIPKVVRQKTDHNGLVITFDGLDTSKNVK